MPVINLADLLADEHEKKKQAREARKHKLGKGVSKPFWASEGVSDVWSVVGDATVRDISPVTDEVVKMEEKVRTQDLTE